MLTRLKVQGFKNLLDVDAYFGPFTCVAGPNAAGKSNLFDAIRFLNLLTQHPILEAVKQLREAKGKSPQPSTLFTSFGDYHADEIAFLAEMVVDRSVTDEFGEQATAAISTLRYEVRFRLNASGDGERIELTHESLMPIPAGHARTILRFPHEPKFRSSCVAGARRGGAFISTTVERSVPYIRLHQEGHGGRKVTAPRSSRTVVGGTATADFPTILAAHREMESWRTLMLEPSAMRAPSFYSDPKRIDAIGAHLASTVARLGRQEPDVLVKLANRLGEMLDDVREVRVQDDERTETLTLQVCGRDGTFHPARSLSDGTLRFLVLATLSLDPEAKGLLCLEEPENGIHPERIPAILDLLRDIAVDPTRAVGDDNPLRQVIVNTHSPPVIQQISAEELMYLDQVEVVENRARGRVAALRAPKGSWRERINGAVSPMSPAKLRPYVKKGEQMTLFQTVDAQVDR
jgi:predicted ATPase